MMNRNWTKKLAALGLSVLVMAMPLAKSEAKDLAQSTFSYGESLTEQERQETRNLLKVKDGSKEIEVKIKELNGLLHDDYPYYQVYSSVYMEPSVTEDGVQVEIVTPKTITVITENQYRNAAITAGAVNMMIRVASVKAVDGSGALAGVYKAFQDAGEALSADNVAVAQKELTVTAKLTEENKEKEGYSDEVMNAALADMKNEIQALKDKQGINIEIGSIQNIVQTVINNYHLDNIVTEEQKEQLSGLMQDFSKLQLTEEQKSALKNFGESLVEKGGQLFEGLQSGFQSFQESGALQSLWDGIVGFFSNAWHWLTGLFS